MKRRNYAIDALRLIAVCFVVYIHIFEINSGFGYTTHSRSWVVVDILFGLARLAVPLFFAISGWYVFSKNPNEQIAKLKKQIPKLVNILLLAVLATTPILWVLTQMHYTYFNLPTVTVMFEMFTLGKSPGTGPLWFLMSLIIVEILYLGATRYISAAKRDGWFFFTALVCFFGVISFSSYRTVFGFGEAVFPVNETWFVAFAWFTLGYFLAKFFKDNPGRVKTKQLLSFTIVAGLLFMYEYIVHTSGSAFVFGPYNYSAVFLFAPFAVSGILLLAARNAHEGKVIRTLAYLGKNYALGVFIIHAVSMQFVNIFFMKSGLLVNAPIPKIIATYSCVLLLSIGVTALYYKVKPIALRYIKI